MRPNRLRMPVPAGEWMPRDLGNRIQEWAADHGFEYSLLPHGNEYGRVILRDPQGGMTITVVPNAHHGRRLNKNQVRFTI